HGLWTWPGSRIPGSKEVHALSPRGARGVATDPPPGRSREGQAHRRAGDLRGRGVRPLGDGRDARIPPVAPTLHGGEEQGTGSKGEEEGSRPRARREGEVRHGAGSCPALGRADGAHHRRRRRRERLLRRPRLTRWLDAVGGAVWPGG